ncbi:MAG: group 1 truncated hemoglobin [Xanthomonadaceae bacterium]|nr:group 1 truncated hemoglobin [Xanthomonadaceae bacterium]MDE1961706.1 group 1 truncated hemoglobin [Xanthomonadaceae bacterium]MDE2085570.1 group 1 truncated hemoglobin [Xanthomonadaceae bacterium]MDE2257440.1 group 1 truncated hemoglobin [Xanthomonadaceae bacterium]
MRTLFLLALIVTTLSGCVQPAPRPASPAAKDALYRELGETPGITRVVDMFFLRINADARINTLFAHVDHNDLRRLVIEQLCQATGGPCVYSGRSMEDAHSGLNLSNADFDAFIGDLQAALDEAKVGKAAQRQLLAVLEPMRPQIVGQ